MEMINKTLAASSRPGYPDTSVIQQCKVDEWIFKVKEAGIVSIICLLHPEEHLRFYTHLPGGGLLKYYRDKGFNVKHIPYKDYQTPILSDDCLEEIYKAYLELPKPVLIHCSAGLGRTGVAIEYLIERG